MTTYATPGVYYERADASPRGIPALRMDVAGFVGIARRGPVDVPVPVQSWRQFQANFGDFTGAGYLAYAVRAFFENGGRKCWIVRVASPAAGETVVGGLAFTMLYRLRALLQTGEVPTLGDVPSGRSGSADPQDDTSRKGSS